MKSLKQVQSELGVTGNASPNWEPIVKVRDILSSEISIKQKGITKNDSILFVTNFTAGSMINGEQPNSLCSYIEGNAVKMIESLAELISERPELIAVLKEAVQFGEYLLIQKTINKANDNS